MDDLNPPPYRGLLPFPNVKSRRASVDLSLGSNKVHPAPDGLGSRSGAGSSRSKNASNLGSAFLEESGREKRERRRSAFQTAAENMLSDTQEAAKKAGPGGKWSLPLFFPSEPRYVRWLAYTMAVALVTAVLDPFNLAFVDNAGIYPYYDFWAVTDYVASATFVADIFTKFCLAYKDEQKGLVTDHKSIALRYLSLMFWVDLLVAAPLDGIIAGAMGIETRDEDPRAQYIALVRWLKVGRLYRLFDLFALIEHKMLLSQFKLMLVRNSTYVFYIVHWLACILYYVARVDGFTENSWLGREDAQARVEGQGLWVKYLYSLYVAMGAFAGVGDEIFYVNSPAETIIMGLYLMLNIAIQAYILGTITIVMVKKDVESQAYRDSVTTLNEFAEANELPKTLYTAMREHVELKFYSERTADEQVLQFYPSTIKRKVLRHLYMEVLKDCYLFQGCKARFLDQVLAAVRMELFMPNVPILNEGDVCNELFLIVDGEVATSAPVDRTGRRSSMLGPYDMGPNLDPEFLAGAQGAADDDADGGGGGFGAGLMRKARRVSALFMNPSLATGFGQGGSLGKGGHNRRASNGSVAGSEKSEDVNGMMKHMGKRSSMQSNGGRRSSVQFNNEDINDMTKHIGRRSSMQSNGGRRSSILFGGGTFGGDSISSAGGMSSAGGSRNNAAYAVHHSSETFSEVPFFIEHPAVVDAWTRSVTRVLVINRHMFQELNKAFPQEVDTILKNLRNRCEGRVRTEVTEATLSGQLDAAMGDELHEVLNGKSFSIIPETRMESIKGTMTFAQRLALEEYKNVRKTLQDNTNKNDQMIVFKFLSAASMGDFDHVKSVVAKGRCLNTTDYDGRSALMLAARENQEEVVDLLLRAGADSSHVDNFGFTALYEAARMGHDDVIQLLLDYKAKLNMDPKITTPALFAAVKAGQAGQVRRFAQVGVSPDCRGFYDRTPLHLAASMGSLTMVRTLVEYAGVRIVVEDAFKRTPLQDADSAGHMHVVAYLKAALKQTRRDSNLLIPEMERLSSAGLFHPVPVSAKPLNILPKRPMSAASNHSSTSAHRRALRAASPVLSLSSHGSHRSIGVYRKTVTDTANNCSPASMVDGDSQRQVPYATNGLLPCTATVSRAAATAVAVHEEAAGDLSSDDGSENSRGSLPTSVRLSPEPRLDESPFLHPLSTKPGQANANLSSSGGGDGGGGAHDEVTPFTLANSRAPEAWHPQPETGEGEHKTRTSGEAGVRPAPPPILPAELSALYSISTPTSLRTSLPTQMQPTVPDNAQPPPPPESQHQAESEPLPVVPPALRPHAPDHPALSSPQPSAPAATAAAAPVATNSSSSSCTREPATLPSPITCDALPRAAPPDGPPPPTTSASSAGVPPSPTDTAARDAEGVHAGESRRASSRASGNKSHTGTPVPPLDFSALRARRAGSPTQNCSTPPPPTSESQSSVAVAAVADEREPSHAQLQQQQQEAPTARDLESVPEPGWQGHAGVPPGMWRAPRSDDGGKVQQQQQPGQYAGPRASTAAITDRPRGVDDPLGLRRGSFVAGAASGALSARMPHEVSSAAAGSTGSGTRAPGVGLLPLQPPMVPGAPRRISQIIREQQAWAGDSSRGPRGPPEGQSNSGLPTGLAPPGRPMFVPHSLLNMPMDLPYPAGNTSRASHRGSGTSVPVAPAMPGLHNSYQPSRASGAPAAVPGAPPLPPHTSGNAATPLPTRTSGNAATPLPTGGSGGGGGGGDSGNRSSGGGSNASNVGGGGSSGISSSAGGGAEGATPSKPRAPADLPWTGSPTPPHTSSQMPSHLLPLAPEAQPPPHSHHQDLPPITSNTSPVLATPAAVAAPYQPPTSNTSSSGSLPLGQHVPNTPPRSHPPSARSEQPTKDSANSMAGREWGSPGQHQQQEQLRPGSGNPRALASQPHHGSIYSARTPLPEIMGDAEIQQLAPFAPPRASSPHHSTIKGNTNSSSGDGASNPLAHSSDTALHEVSQLLREPGGSRPGLQGRSAQAQEKGKSLQAPGVITRINEDELDPPPPPSFGTPAAAPPDQHQHQHLQQQHDGVVPSSERPPELEGTALLGSVHRGSLVLQPFVNEPPASSSRTANPAAALNPGRPVATPRGGQPRTSLDAKRLHDQPLPPSSRGSRPRIAGPTTGDVDSLIQEMR